MVAERTYRFIISGGGTGGHIYPALAVAGEIKARYANAEILFVGAKGRMEISKVPEAGFEIIGLWISGLQRKLTLKNFLFPFKVISSYFSARNIVKRFKPDAVVGFGGYASGPIMLAATGMQIPSMIQEQNSYAGITNKRLGARVKKICVAYDKMERFFPKEKIRFTGNPVRKEILYIGDKKAQAYRHFNLDENKKTILVIGGSLGARTINNGILKGIKEFDAAGYQLVWQTGKFYYSEMTEKAAKDNLPSIHILEFIKEMDLAYAASDIVISRAGALSVSELCLAGKPVVFVPSPNVAEDHQTKNAMALVKKDAALMVKDKEVPERLIPEVLKLAGDEKKQQVLASNIKTMGRPYATREIVDELFEMIA